VSAVDAVRNRLPSPPPAAIAASRKWPLGTIAAIVGVVIVGVLASAYAIKSTQHEPADLPAVITAHPSPPLDTVLHTTQKAPPLPAAQAVAAVEAKKAKPRPIAQIKRPAEPPPPVVQPAAATEPPKKVIPPLFPPTDKVAPTVGSLDGLPSIKTIEVKGSTADTAIRKAVEQTLSPLRGCYRAAARAKQQTPQVDLTIAFDIDARRQPIKVRAIGGGALDSLPACASKVTSDIRDLPAPTTGASVRVSVSLEFRPNP
jgi:hypothetical protein